MTTELESAEEILAKAVGIPATDLVGVPPIPPFLTSLVHDYAQKLLTTISVYLLAHGASRYTNEADLVAFGLGTVGFVLSCAWTLGSAYLRKKREVALLNATPPIVK